MFCLPCGRAVALQPPSLPSSTSSHLILVPLARPALGSVTSKRNCIYCISRMQLPFRRAIDVVLSPEEGMQAGPIPVAPRVVSDIPYVIASRVGAYRRRRWSKLTERSASYPRHVLHTCMCWNCMAWPWISTQGSSPVALGSSQTTGLSAEVDRHQDPCMARLDSGSLKLSLTRSVERYIYGCRPACCRGHVHYL